jgi:cellulose synthase/poly-beta-1,6-N-acetylglucosamine synthase-like glycosyltransferase
MLFLYIYTALLMLVIVINGAIIIIGRISFYRLAHEYSFNYLDSLPRSLSIVTIYRRNTDTLSKFIESLPRPSCRSLSIEVVVADASHEEIPVDHSSRAFCSVLRVDPVKTKSEVQNYILSQLKSEFVLLCDIEFLFSEHAVEALVASAMGDETVGVVSGIIGFRSESLASGDARALASNYTKYRNIENYLRFGLSKIGLLGKCDGMCVLIRRKVFRELPAYIGEDQILSLLAAEGGYKTTFIPYFVGSDCVNENMRQELAQRRRMTCRALQGCFYMRPRTTHSWRYIAIFSTYMLTKIIRFVFIPLFAICFIAWVAVFSALFIAPLVFITVTLVALVKPARSLIITCYAFLLGIFDFIRGARYVERVTRSIS